MLVYFIRRTPSESILVAEQKLVKKRGNFVCENFIKVSANKVTAVVVVRVQGQIDREINDASVTGPYIRRAFGSTLLIFYYNRYSEV